MDTILRGLRIGAFAGLAVSVFAVATDSKWHLEPLGSSGSSSGSGEEVEGRKIQKDLKTLSLPELKERYKAAIQEQSPTQRLFSLLALAFVTEPQVDDEDDPAFLAAQCKSADLLAVAKQLGFPVRADKILFHPGTAFSEDNLARLRDLKRGLQELHAAITAVTNNTGQHQQQQHGTEWIEAEHRKYMQSLHEYNEVKDVGQALLGKLAQLTGQTTRKLYPDFGLSLEE